MAWALALSVLAMVAILVGLPGLALVLLALSLSLAGLLSLLDGRSAGHHGPR